MAVYNSGYNALGNGQSMIPATNLWFGDNYSSGNLNQRPMRQQIGMQSQHLQTINNVLQVMGPESAMAYQVGPNSMVILMDTNRPVFYLKRSDDSGYSETKAFEFHEIALTEKIIDANANVENVDYATKEDIDDIKKQLGRRDYVTKKDFDALKKVIERMSDKDA